MTLKVATVSLGCNKNQVDTEIMLGYLYNAGYELTSQLEDAEIILINTCGFVQEAVEESIQTILEFARFKLEGKCKVLVVTGCMVQRYKNEIKKEMPEIDAILGTGDFTRVVDVIEKVLRGEEEVWKYTPSKYLYNENTPRILTTPWYWAYVKIAEGCNNCCSYCTIPSIRGEFRSRKIESVVREVENLAEKGVKEINLIAQDVTNFGIDNYDEYKLSSLLKTLARVENIAWLRLLYAYPTGVTNELIRVIAQEGKICKYLDLPLQHIADSVLQKMNRKGRKKDILALLHKLRREIPEIVLRTSLIVGFPGETEKDFKELEEFVQDVEFERLGVFKYSREEGTFAAELPEQVPEEVKEERYHRLMRIQQKISLKKNRALKGKVLEVLVEGYLQEGQNVLIGRSRRDAPEIDGVVYVYGSNAMPGDIIKARITEGLEYDLVGEVV